MGGKGQSETKGVKKVKTRSDNTVPIKRTIRKAHGSRRTEKGAKGDEKIVIK